MFTRFLLLVLCCICVTVSYADPKVYSPYVKKGELAIETRGNTTIDDDNNKDGSQRHVFELEYGVTDWWKTAFVARLNKPGDGTLRYDSTAWENIIQLTEKGKYWLDAGLYLEYKLADESSVADKFETKLLFEKPAFGFRHTLNLVFEKEVGEHSKESVEFEYAWRTTKEIAEEIALGIEAFGGVGEIRNTKSLEDQEHRLGPVFYHEVEIGGMKIDYNLAWLFGLTDASPDHTFRWQLEFEF
ncbi:MAG: hypothetical protein A2W76_02320 [Gammaproteobacteria bacterium RIFCSPLOWO2_12_47_11]|nr:MAG: hypothetical protein A2W76_02320 [Gammaproteobacteria bacterium RIFCSPLOWO2_12_47_11]